VGQTDQSAKKRLNMIDIILSDRVYVFSVILCIIAIVTKKDLAVFAAAISVAASFVWYENLSNAFTYTLFCALNSLLVIIAGCYNSIKNTPLTKVVVVLGSLACVLNMIQIYDVSAVSGIVSTGLVVVLMISLLFIDGRKGLLDGLYGDMRDSVLRHVHLFSNYNNNKNS
tara:strand:- start:507 stop:1016 length:510 start_codon:yes stop_codon:yes gene_type:complete